MNPTRITKASHVRIRRGSRWVRGTAIRVEAGTVWFITSRTGKYGHRVHTANVADVMPERAYR